MKTSLIIIFVGSFVLSSEVSSLAVVLRKVPSFLGVFPVNVLVFCVTSLALPAVYFSLVRLVPSFCVVGA